MGFGEAEYRAPFGRVVFEPVGEFRGCGPVLLGQFVESGLRLLDPLRVPHFPQLGPDPLLNRCGGGAVEGVALQ